MNYLNTLYLSFFNLNFYRDVHRWTVGRTLGFFATTLAIFSAILMITGTFTLHRHAFHGEPSRAEILLRDMASQWPDGVIDNNQLATHEARPHIIYGTLENAREALLTIDTSGATTIQNSTTNALITKDAIIIKRDHNVKVDMYDLQEFYRTLAQPYIVNSAVMQRHVTDFLAFAKEDAFGFYAILVPIMWLVLFFTLAILRLLLLLPLALVAWIFGRTLSPKLSYGACFCVLCVAMIPLTIISVLSLLLLGSGVSTWLMITVALGVLLLTLDRNSKTA